MGHVAEVFRWNSIGPGQTVGVTMRGRYRMNEFISYAINIALASNQPFGAYETISAQLTEGSTNALPSGDVSRTVWVENQTLGPQPYITVGLLRFRQTTLET